MLQGMDEVSWKIPVFDAVLMRPRTVLVEVSETRVVVVPPAGSGYVVPPESITPLCDALRAANSVATHRRRAARDGGR